MREKILVTVKTYPQPSGKYDELVCCAGVREDGSWVRFYPLPFRRLKDYSRFNKWNWLNIDLIKNSSDPRPESYRPIKLDKIRVGSLVGTEKGTWRTRGSFALNKIYLDRETLVADARHPKINCSLAVFKPTKITDFYAVPTDRQWPENILRKMEQQRLFGERLQPLPKLPYDFKYKIQDNSGKIMKMKIIDWEVGALYWRMMQKYNNEQKAIDKVRQKYFIEYPTRRNIVFFLGTTRLRHGWARNPFLIIGMYCPLKNNQTQLPI